MQYCISVNTESQEISVSGEKGSKGEEKLLSIPDLSAPGDMEITLSAVAFVTKNKSAAMLANIEALKT